MGRNIRSTALAVLVIAAGTVTWALLNPSPDPKVAALDQETAVMAVNATERSSAKGLHVLALDEKKRATVRYAALRRLEQQSPAEAVELAEKLATDPTRSESADFLRANAVAVLTRLNTDEAKAALERARKASPENETLAAQLAAAKGGK